MTSTSCTSFNNGVSQDSPVAMSIDLQSFNKMTAEDAQGYADFLADRLERFRQNNIPIIWAGITDEDRLVLPENPQEEGQPQDFETLTDKGFCVHALDEETSAIYKDFIETHGPRTNEVIALKSYASALLEVGDNVTADPAYSSQGRELSTQNLSLMQYMRNQEYTHPLIFGGTSSFCVAQTAQTGAAKGLNVTLDPDLMLSWDKMDPAEQNQEDSLFVWREGLDAENARSFHINHITTALDKIESNSSNGFTSHDRGRIHFADSQAYINSFTSPAETDIISQPESAPVRTS